MTEPLRESVGVAASGWKVRNHRCQIGFGTFVGGGIAVEEVERAFTVFCGNQRSRRLALEKVGGRGSEGMVWWDEAG